MKSILSAATLIWAMAISPSAAQDAVDVDSEHHKVEFENEQIRVVRMVYPVGYKTPMHGHLPGVTVSLSTASVHSWQASGEENDGGAEFGTVSWSDGTAVHANQVTGDSPLELVRVEIKKKGTAAIAMPTHDTVKVDPAHHKLELENDQVRVVRATYPAGYTTPLHNHLPGITVSLTERRNSRGELIPKGHASELGDGGDPHESTFDTATELVRVELKTKP
jgi:quercetin dioxygenase-like cupin family protein